MSVWDDRYLGICLVLLAASYCDVRARRVPNALIVAGLVAAFVMQGVWYPTKGLGSALQGCLGALGCTLPLYFLRGLGAGDVKLLAVVGAFVGWPAVGKVMLVSLWLAGIFGVGVLCWRRGLGDYLGRYFRMFRQWLATGRFDYLPPGSAEPAAMTLPFVPFIAMGTGWVLYFDRG